MFIALDANPEVSSEFKDLLIAENSGLDSMLDQIVVTYGSKAVKHFDEKLLPYATTRVRLVGYCRDITHKKRPGNGIGAKITGVLKSAGGVFKRVPEAFKSLFEKIKGIFHK